MKSHSTASVSFNVNVDQFNLIIVILCKFWNEKIREIFISKWTFLTYYHL